MNTSTCRINLATNNCQPIPDWQLFVCLLVNLLGSLCLGLGFLSLLLFLVTELAVIHQTADGRLGVRRDLAEVDIGFFGHAQCFRGADNPDLGAIDAGQTDLRNSDLTIDPMLAILSYDSTPENE